ncbi:MAG TPA: glycosyltransferase N-terminal domain-containing protein [candidate division Zixibacteria bacterium]|nr:glycosyltransferase N-terminal domain-containing protein [candidate division Zixibacteria bacterium]
MRILYRIVSAIIFFVLWPYGRIRALWGSKKWQGRLGLLETAGPVDVWIHAASVGETKIAGYLIDYLKHKQPDIRIFLSTMTDAGQKIAEKIRNEKVNTGYFPIDSGFVVKRYLSKVRPKMMVITETEIWPNVLEECFYQKIPVVLVNGRMSDRAFKKYRLVGSMLSIILSKYDKIFVKSDSDRKKFLSFGLSEEKTMLAGDMKFDAPLLRSSEHLINAARSKLGAGVKDFLLVAGSTRPGEEALLLELFERMSQAVKPIRLVIAPRHLNRIELIKLELSSKKVEFVMYGSGNGTAPVTLVDKMGELDKLYQAADLAFVGGTLVNVGGHNILEPVWAGTPVVFGPYVNNVIDAKEYVLQNKFGAMVETIGEMSELIQKYFENRAMFSRKSADDLSHSPTALVGEYILERLSRV